MMPLAMQPGFRPPLCAEIDRLSMLAEVRRQIMIHLMDDPTAPVPKELTDKEEELGKTIKEGERR